jgi:hypothetical protein
LAEARVILPALTLDTNLIIQYADKNDPHVLEDLETIIVAATMGKISIAVTTRVKDDILKDNDSDRKKRSLKYLARFPEIGIGFVMGTSVVGGKDYLCDKEYTDLRERLQKILFPNLSESDNHYHNKINDLDHITGHKYSLRDYFVTQDNDFFKRGEELKNNCSIEVIFLDECISKLI